MAEVYGGHKSAQLIELAKPFPKNFIHDDGRGNAYVPHHIVTQRLIQIFGAPPRIEILRETYDGDKLTGVFMRLTVPGFEPVEEAGEADNPQSKTNGARAKDACSDAIKRCAMRLGLGLHLWAQEDYFLHDVLTRDSGEAHPTQPSSQTGSEVSPDTSKAKSAPIPAAEPQVAAPSPATEKSSIPAASSPSSSGGASAVASSVGEVHEESVTTPSGEPFALITQAIGDKRVSQAKVLATANKVALEKKAIPEKGISSKTLIDLPDDVLDEIARVLNLKQEVMTG